MNRLIVTICFLLIAPFISPSEFTICSYNCGGISDHYDYLRAATMQKLMQERHIAEPENMALNDKIQQLALKIIFGDNQEQANAQQEWDQKGFQRTFEKLTAAPTVPNSPNTAWNTRAVQMITNYKTRPVEIFDQEILNLLNEHFADLVREEKVDIQESLQETRDKMAKRIFAHQLKYDIICFQEGDYLYQSIFPERYTVLFSDSLHSINGVAWNKERFEHVHSIGDILGRAFAVKLRDKETNKTVLVASAHLSGCNPYCIEFNPYTNIGDSEKGDRELRTIIDCFERENADIKLIGMDSNVTALHPRLEIIKNAGYKIDCDYFENTCANPYQVLNTRIDWITINSLEASITNIPVLNVGLNSIQTNISDHKPIAAKIKLN